LARRSLPRKISALGSRERMPTTAGPPLFILVAMYANTPIRPATSAQMLAVVSKAAKITAKIKV
jgi:hypothetical protein